MSSLLMLLSILDIFQFHCSDHFTPSKQPVIGIVQDTAANFSFLPYRPSPLGAGGMLPAGPGYSPSLPNDYLPMLTYVPVSICRCHLAIQDIAICDDDQS